MEQALSEHYALVRQVHALSKQYKEWHMFVEGLISRVQGFGRRAKKPLDDGFKTVQTVCGVLRGLQKAYFEADEARIPFKINLTASPSLENNRSLKISSSKFNDSSTTTLVSPLDSLTRGVAGPEVAALIQSLRMNHSSLQLFDEELIKMVNSYTAIMQSEQRELLEYVRNKLDIVKPKESVLQPTSGNSIGNTVRSAKRSIRSGRT